MGDRDFVMTPLFKAIVLIPFYAPRLNFQFEPQKKDMKIQKIQFLFYENVF